MLIKLVRLCLVLCLLLCSLPDFAQPNAIQAQLADLKKQNNLTEWLYVRIDYANAHLDDDTFLNDTRIQAWRQPKTADEQVAWLTLITTLGYNQLQAGDILKSINSYEEAYTFFKKYKVPFDFAEYIVKPLGNNYARLGDYERAIFLQRSTINALNKATEPDKVAALFSNLAISYYNIGKYDDAEKSVAQGLALVQDVQVRFNLNNTLADILVQKNELKPAQKLLINNIASLQQVNTETAYGLTGSYTTLGNIHLQNKQFSSSEIAFNKALQLLNKYYPTDRQREKAYLTTQLGKLLRLQRQWQNALAKFNTALQILRINTVQNTTPVEKIYGENKLVDIFHEKAQTYIQLRQPALALQNMRYALLATDKMRKEFADNKTKERLQQEGKQLAEKTIALAFNLYTQTNQQQYLDLILEVSEQTKARTLADDIQKNYYELAAAKSDSTMRRKLDMERAISYNERLMMTEQNPSVYKRKIDALKFELALLNKKYRESTAGTVPNANKLLKALPSDVHLLEFFFGTDKVYVIEVKSNRVAAVNRIDSAAALHKTIDSFVDTFYRHGPEAMANWPKRFYQQSYAIYTMLFKNIGLKRNEKLCIVPDDVLGYLSFDGLITDEKFGPAPSLWPYLIRQVTVSYAFSVNTLSNKHNSAPVYGGFSGLFITHEAASDKPIMAVKREAAAIEKLVEGHYLYDDEVNTTSFFRAFENSSALHISTHAYLWGANREPTLDFGKQKLFLFELLARAHKPNLVVLSACRTGDGTLAQGEGIISLSRGFIAIGTAATVSGLWNVNDDAVSRITANMYAGITKGQNTASALHNAKLNWLNDRQATDAMYMPYYWDALVFTGANEVLGIRPAKNWDALQIGIAVIVLAIGGVIILVRKKK